MCSIICDYLWRRWELGTERVEDRTFYLNKLTVIYDIISDFIFWYSIRNDQEINVIITWLVLLFACIGFLIDFIGSCCILKNSSPDAWGCDVEKASDNYQKNLRYLSNTLSIFEDIPQLILGVIITYQKSELTLEYIISTIGSIINIIKNIILNNKYLKLRKEAQNIIINERKKYVKYKFRGNNLYTFEWRATNRFSERNPPENDGIDKEINSLC